MCGGRRQGGCTSVHAARRRYPHAAACLCGCEGSPTSTTMDVQKHCFGSVRQPHRVVRPRQVAHGYECYRADRPRPCTTAWHAFAQLILRRSPTVLADQPLGQLVVVLHGGRARLMPLARDCVRISQPGTSCAKQLSVELGPRRTDIQRRRATQKLAQRVCIHPPHGVSLPWARCHLLSSPSAATRAPCLHVVRGRHGRAISQDV